MQRLRPAPGPTQPELIRKLVCPNHLCDKVERKQAQQTLSLCLELCVAASMHSPHEKLEDTPYKKPRRCCTPRRRFRFVVFLCSFTYAVALLIVGIISYYMILSEVCTGCSFPYVHTVVNETAAATQARIDATSQLRLNYIQTLGTHNSYHVAGVPTIPYWQYTHDRLDIQLDNGMQTPSSGCSSN